MTKEIMAECVEEAQEIIKGWDGYYYPKVDVATLAVALYQERMYRARTGVVLRKAMDARNDDKDYPL